MSFATARQFKVPGPRQTNNIGRKNNASSGYCKHRKSAFIYVGLASVKCTITLIFKWITHNPHLVNFIDPFFCRKVERWYISTSSRWKRTVETKTSCRRCFTITAANSKVTMSCFINWFNRNTVKYTLGVLLLFRCFLPNGISM